MAAWRTFQNLCFLCCQVGHEEVVVMPIWSPPHEHFGVAWSLLCSVLLRSFMFVTWWNHGQTDCYRGDRGMTLALLCPQDCKQLQQVSLGSVLALVLHPSVFISVSY